MFVLIAAQQMAFDFTNQKFLVSAARDLCLRQEQVQIRKICQDEGRCWMQWKLARIAGDMHECPAVKT